MTASKKRSAIGEIKEPSLLDQLIGAISAQKAAFYCGGDVLVSEDDESPASRFEDLTRDDNKAISPPIVIRWDLPSGKTLRKLTLPPSEGADGDNAIGSLLKHSTPATSGKKGEEVLDESYQKAAKLDANHFSTNFNPYDVGIVDAIAQVLLPGIAKPFADGRSTFEDHLGVVAELYKLNVS